MQCWRQRDSLSLSLSLCLSHTQTLDIIHQDRPPPSPFRNLKPVPQILHLALSSFSKPTWPLSFVLDTRQSPIDILGPFSVDSRTVKHITSVRRTYRTPSTLSTFQPSNPSTFSFVIRFEPSRLLPRSDRQTSSDTSTSDHQYYYHHPRLTRPTDLDLLKHHLDLFLLPSSNPITVLLGLIELSGCDTRPPTHSRQLGAAALSFSCIRCAELPPLEHHLLHPTTATRSTRLVQALTSAQMRGSDPLDIMYSNSPSALAANPASNQKPETFMLSNEAQSRLPQDAQVALQQVDNRESPVSTLPMLVSNG